MYPRFSFVTCESCIRRETAAIKKFSVCRRSSRVSSRECILHIRFPNRFPLSRARSAARDSSHDRRSHNGILQKLRVNRPYGHGSRPRGKHCSYRTSPFVVKRRSTMHAERQRRSAERRANDEQWSSGIRTDVHKSSIWCRPIVAEPNRCNSASTQQPWNIARAS